MGVNFTMTARILNQVVVFKRMSEIRNRPAFIALE
jgi:hypothetical protein